MSTHQRDTMRKLPSLIKVNGKKVKSTESENKFTEKKKVLKSELIMGIGKMTSATVKE